MILLGVLDTPTIKIVFSGHFFSLQAKEAENYEASFVFLWTFLEILLHPITLAYLSNAM